MKNSKVSTAVQKSIETKKAAIARNNTQINELNADIAHDYTHIDDINALYKGDNSNSLLTSDDFLNSKKEIKQYEKDISSASEIRDFLINQNKNLNAAIKEETEEYKKALHSDNFDELTPDMLEFNRLAQALFEQGKKINAKVKKSDLETSIRTRAMYEVNIFAGQTHWDLIDLNKIPSIVVDKHQKKFIPMSQKGVSNTIREYDAKGFDDYEI